MRAAMMVALLPAGALAAGVHTRWSAKLAVGAGYDSNLLADGTGGAPLFAVMPALGYFAQGPRLALDTSYQGRMWAFWTRPGDNAGLHEGSAKIEGTVGHGVELRISERLRAADDPVGLARLGLVGSPDPALRQRLAVELAFPTTARSALVLRGRHELVHFFQGETPSLFTGANGAHGFAPELAMRWDATRRVRCESGYRAQLFFEGWDLANTSHAVQGQLAWRATRRWTVGALLGASVLGGDPPWMPRAKVWAEWLHRDGELVASASRDLALGGGRIPGVNLSDQIELAASRELGGPFSARIAGALYRSGRPPRFASDLAGSMASATLSLRLGSGFSTGLFAERFAMLWGEEIEGRHDRAQLAALLSWSHP